MKKSLLLLRCMFFMAMLTYGQIINVPNDQPTIQSAINASVDGDTVLVADGTYYENINFKGKAITLASWFLIDEDDTHIDSTIINGSQPTKPDSASVVWFSSCEDTTSVLYGFTITGGKGSNPPEATHNSWGAGGIAINSGAKIIYNKIVFNTVTTDNGYGYGGGILVAFTSRPVQIIKNIISNNKIIGIGENENGGGGGIFCANVSGSELIIADNIITNHFLTSNSFGGAIQFAHFSAKPDIRNNLIINNVAKFSGGLHFVDYTGVESINLINNTIVNNYATEKGGAINHLGGGPLSIVNSIIWRNRAPNNPQIYGNVNVKYSNVEDGYEGIGNIDQDPLFADTINYYLTATSPCVDAGNPEGFFNDLTDPNNPGFPLFPALGGLRNDMGAYGGNPYMIMTETPDRIFRSCLLNNTYYVPGIDTLIVTSEIFSPENQLVNVQAIIESYDGSERDSIQMYDDGTHNDNIEGDGFYTGFWPVINKEENFQIHISTYLVDYQYSVLLKNAASFSTKGPIIFEDLSITSNDTIPNPGDRIRFSMTLKNLGITDTVYNVCAWIIITDTSVSNSKRGILKFGDIAPGESLTNWSRDFALTINDSCDPSSYEFELEIISKEVYWHDTFTIDVLTGIEVGSSNLPKEFALAQNYPNPFNPSTTIKYEIPSVASGFSLSSVTLKVYDILGREVATLVNEQQKAGYYEVEFGATNLTSGIYFYRIQAGDFVDVKKMVLMK